MKNKGLQLGSLFILLLTSITFAGCRIGLTEDYRLGVPYEEQEQFDYCVPASVLMWREYDGIGKIPQSTIYNWLGGHACSPYDVPRAVNNFTNTFDAYLDLAYSPSETARRELVARQITSEDNRSPVIAIVGSSRNHVGVINGGKYAKNGSLYEWDFLYFHDPAPGGENSYFAADRWMDYFCGPGYGYCGQILSSGATTGWQNYYATYGNSIYYGGSATCIGARCGPYQN